MGMAFAGFQRRLGRRLFFAAPLALAAGAAAAQGTDVKFKRSALVIETGGRELKFDVDMATNDIERSHGLMFRKSLGPYEGMLFDFHQEAPVSFWMKNTLIPLDMLFADEAGVILTIHENAVPLDETAIPGGDGVKYVLEINGGMASRLGIAVGDVLQNPVLGPGAAAPCG